KRTVSDRVYEILFIADPNLGEPEVDALAATVQGYAEKEGGRVTKVEKWGKKRLAYEVKRHAEGSYVLVVAEGRAEMVKEVERRMKVADGVIKFITVRVDDELRKADRRKARRALEDANKKPRPAPAPEPPADEGVSL